MNKVSGNIQFGTEKALVADGLRLNSPRSSANLTRHLLHLG